MVKGKIYIRGYQVCKKWLKDRQKRELSYEDIRHYEKIVVALGETIRLMKHIDEVIDAHTVWPINKNLLSSTQAKGRKF